MSANRYRYLALTLNCSKCFVYINCTLRSPKVINVIILCLNMKKPRHSRVSNLLIVTPELVGGSTRVQTHTLWLGINHHTISFYRIYITGVYFYAIFPRGKEFTKIAIIRFLPSKILLATLLLLLCVLYIFYT